MASPPSPADRQADPLLRVLDLGLAAVVVLAPLPFGAVVPAGRLGLEAGAFLLGAVWAVRALVKPTPLPPRPVCVGLALLVLLGLAQSLPLGVGPTSALSPASVHIRDSALAPPAVRETESRLLGADVEALLPAPSLSVAPDATASALRTGAAFALLLLVSTTVAATRGPRTLALALLVSAAFQSLYGILVLASGHDMIWHLPKRYFLDCATGTYVNRNHFAGFLEAALPCGLALALSRTGSRRPVEGVRARFVALFSTEGNRTLLLGLLVVLGLAGLLLSFSRAGIALGITALLVTALTAGSHGVRARLVAVALALLVTAVPLAQVGADRLARRYAETPEHVAAAGHRTTVWSDTLAMAAAFPAVGTGFGTFAVAYPLHRSPEVRRFYDHAHNDPVQWLAEGGLVAAALLALILVPLARRIVAAVAARHGVLALGFAAGLAALLLHGLVDFNFHIPANGAVGAVLAGALLGLPWNDPR